MVQKFQFHYCNLSPILSLFVVNKFQILVKLDYLSICLDSMIRNNAFLRPLHRHGRARTYFWKCNVFNWTYWTEGKMWNSKFLYQRLFILSVICFPQDQLLVTTRKQPHLLDVYYCSYSYLSRRSLGVSEKLIFNVINTNLLI